MVVPFRVRRVVPHSRTPILASFQTKQGIRADKQEYCFGVIVFGLPKRPGSANIDAVFTFVSGAVLVVILMLLSASCSFCADTVAECLAASEVTLRTSTTPPVTTGAVASVHSSDVASLGGSTTQPAPPFCPRSSSSPVLACLLLFLLPLEARN